MSTDEFDFITVRELFLKMEGWKDQRREEERNRLYWLRWQTAALLNIQLDKKHQVKPEQLFTLDYEHKKHTIIPDETRRQEIIEMKERWKDFKQTPATLDDLQQIILKAKKN